MRAISAVAVLAAVLGLASGCASGGAPTVLGRNLTVMTDGEGRVKGELLAVEEGRIVLRSGESATEVPLAAVREVEIKRHNWDGRRGFLWSLIGGLASGAALTSACNRTSDGCGGVGAVTVGLWLAVGGLSSLAMDSASRQRIERPTEADLRPLARFPQGLPPGFALSTAPATAR